METYFILDKFGFLKIGRSVDSEIRIGQIKTANPHVILTWKIKGNYEKTLHKLFSYYKYNGEWYSFQSEYKLSKSIMRFDKWIIHEIMLTIDAINKNRINDLLEIRLTRNIKK
jgi:hypothetical protein